MHTKRPLAYNKEKLNAKKNSDKTTMFYITKSSHMTFIIVTSLILPCVTNKIRRFRNQKLFLNIFQPRHKGYLPAQLASFQKEGKFRQILTLSTFLLSVRRFIFSALFWNSASLRSSSNRNEDTNVHRQNTINTESLTMSL
jgi:hypothetical protein